MTGLALIRTLLSRVASAFILAVLSQAGWAAAEGGGYTITGTVVSARDGSPVPLAVLHAVPSPSGIRLAETASTAGGAGRGRFAGQSGQHRGRVAATTSPVEDASATADGSGHFHMELPHSGRWTLTATASGFAAQQFDEHQGYFASVVVNEQVGTYSLIFRLTPAALIAGNVVDEAGEPVEQAQVSAELLPTGVADNPEDAQVRPAGFATTDDRGHYELTRLEPGRYRVKIVATPWYTQVARNNGFARGTGAALQARGASAGTSPDPSLDMVYSPTWFPGTPEVNTAETVTLQPGEEREADVHLTATPAVHLEVPLPAAAAGEGRRNNTVVITRVASSGFDFATQVMPGDNGVGRSGSLSPGLYQIRRNGFESSSIDTADDDIREIEVPAGASGTVTLENARPLIKMTAVFDGPAAGTERPGELVLIDIVSGRRITSAEGQTRRFRTDETANSQATPAERIFFAPPGRYAVYLESSQQANYLTGLSADGAEVQGRMLTLTGGRPKLTVHAGSGRAEIGGTVETAAQAGQLAGTDLTRTPVEGAMVVLVPVTLGQPGDLAQPYRDESNTDGSFDLANVIPGKYILIAIDRGWDVEFHDPAALARYLIHGLPLEVKSGNHLERRIEAQAP